MSIVEPRAAVASIDSATQVSLVGLSVANLDRSIAFYTEALGFAVLRRSGSSAILGVADAPLLALTEQSGALPWMTDGMTGLYHFAVLVPSRPDLGRWLRHFLALGFPPPGQGDHVVSEALYLRDPDGHGIEVYQDRPRETWRWVGGQVQMGTGPVDVRGLLAEAGSPEQRWGGMRAGTRVGHIHLQVGDVAEAESFYHQILGFDVVARMPTALFVSAGGYHHHIGMNVWHSRGAPPPPPDTASLKFYTLILPTDEAVAAVTARLAGARVAHQEAGGAVTFHDPWRNRILLHTGRMADPDGASAFLSAVSKLTT